MLSAVDNAAGGIEIAMANSSISIGCAVSVIIAAAVGKERALEAECRTVE